MIELPTKPRKGDSEQIQSMLIISRPKVGKTSALMKLPNCLVIDLENSSGYYDGMAINVLKEANENKTSPIKILKETAKAIKKSDHKYDFIVLDTITRLEDECIAYATHMYKNSPQGASYTGNNVVTDLDYGGGYNWLRKAFLEMITLFQGLCKTLIFTGHIKDSSIKIKGRDLTANDIDLTGKIKKIITSRCDAIGKMYRDLDKEVNMLSFEVSPDDILCGARPKHIANKEFVISKLVHQGLPEEELKTNWKKLFRDLD